MIYADCVVSQQHCASQILLYSLFMVATLHTVTFQGLKPQSIEVQAQLQPGLPSFIIAGLADKAVTEARERVRGALQAMGLSLPLCTT